MSVDFTAERTESGTKSARSELDDLHLLVDMALRSSVRIAHLCVIIVIVEFRLPNSFIIFCEFIFLVGLVRRSCCLISVVEFDSLSILDSFDSTFS
jgi:hypothetical protein